VADLPEVLGVVRRLGVRDLSNPSPREVKLVLDAYLKDKSLNTEAFNAYAKSLSAPLKAMVEGFAQFSADSRDVSKKTIDVIQQAMDILKGELSRPDISDDDRRQVLDHALRLVAEARDESDRERRFRSRLAQYVVGGTVVVVGTGVMIVTAGKYPGLMEKGLKLAGKAAGKTLSS
jgi:hypothetical protein